MEVTCTSLSKAASNKVILVGQRNGGTKLCSIQCDDLRKLNITIPFYGFTRTICRYHTHTIKYKYKYKYEYEYKYKYKYKYRGRDEGGYFPYPS